MSEGESDLERILGELGGASAARESAAQLHALLDTELARGQAELARPRTGYPQPIVVALAPIAGAVVAAVPVPPSLRADPSSVSERARDLTAGVVGTVVEGAAPPPATAAADLRLQVGSLGGALALRYPAPDPEFVAAYAREALDELFSQVDRLRARALLLPAHVLEPLDDLREPIGPKHPLRVAEALARLDRLPPGERVPEAAERMLLELLEPPDGLARAHDDPDPVRRVARRILQRLDGMGKWGGYHTAFDHLARGFAGHDRSLAYDVGEALVAADLLAVKPSVGQRHVCLNPRRSGDIRRLIDAGEQPAGLSLPAAS